LIEGAKRKIQISSFMFVELMLISKDGASNVDSDDENLCKINWGILGLSHI